MEHLIRSFGELTLHRGRQPTRLAAALVKALAECAATAGDGPGGSEKPTVVHVEATEDAEDVPDHPPAGTEGLHDEGGAGPDGAVAPCAAAPPPTGPLRGMTSLDVVEAVAEPGPAAGGAGDPGVQDPHGEAGFADDQEDEAKEAVEGGTDDPLRPPAGAPPPAGPLRGTTSPDAVEAVAEPAMRPEAGAPGVQAHREGACDGGASADVGTLLHELGTAMASATPAPSAAERWAVSAERAQLLRDAEVFRGGSSSADCKQS